MVRLWAVRARRLWGSIPDCFGLLDWILIVAGVRFESRVGWQRFAWNLYVGVGYFQFLIGVVNFFGAVVNVEDVVMTVWSTNMVAAEIQCLLKHVHLLRHDVVIKEVRNFLQGTGYSSGDSEFDAGVRKRFRNNTRILLVVFGVQILIVQIFCWIPNSLQLRTFHIPSWIGRYFGTRFAWFIQVIYISAFASFWASKLFCCTIVAAVLMTGVKVEQEILVHQLGNLEDELKDLWENYHESDHTQILFWERFKSLVQRTMKHQSLILLYADRLCNEPNIELIPLFTEKFKS